MKFQSLSVTPGVHLSETRLLLGSTSSCPPVPALCRDGGQFPDPPCTKTPMKRRPRGGWRPRGSWGEAWWGVLTGKLSDSVWPRGAEPASAVSEVLVQSLEFTVRRLTLVIHIRHVACAPHTVTTGRTPPTGGPDQVFGKWQNSIDHFKSTTKLWLARKVSHVAATGKLASSRGFQFTLTVSR